MLKTPCESAKAAANTTIPLNATRSPKASQSPPRYDVEIDGFISLTLKWWHGGAGLTERSERGSLSAVAMQVLFCFFLITFRCSRVDQLRAIGVATLPYGLIRKVMAKVIPIRANNNPAPVRIFLCEGLGANARQAFDNPLKLTQIPIVAGLISGLFVTFAASQKLNMSNASQKSIMNRLAGFG